MHDGWAKFLTSHGYQILHEHSTRGTFGDRESVRTKILKDGKVVCELEQNWDSRGGSSLAQIYKDCAVKLKLVDAKNIPEHPVDLDISEQGEEGSARHSIVFRHPSFGLISIGRYSGRGKHFMSPIDTAGGIKMTVHSAQLQHDIGLGTDHVYETGILAEVSMSFTQFAEMITSAGVGAGVPCTLEFMEGVPINSCEIPSAEERLEKNAEASMNEAVAEITKVMEEIEVEMKGPGGLSAGRKKEIYQKLHYAFSGVSTKPKWLLRVWKEHINTTLTHAKSEFAHWAKDYAGRLPVLQARIYGSEQPESPPALKKENETGG